MVQLAELVVAWGMEQGCEELVGSDAEVEDLLEGLQLDCLVEGLEVQLPEEGEEVVLLAELVEVAWEMEQGCEHLHMVEQALEAMQLEHKYLVEDVQVQPTEEGVQLAALVVVVQVGQAKEQGSEEHDVPDGEVEEPF